ncbi:hypothetical protein NUW58_g7875 [Xylaria curta]|uniref:Uncharacterized protein n=1 Tax=Xylaria curta TaxID=42375 RepID=A0ACC1NEK3_9PEZI|nr:hypothetical protein NUW58_g7875 [Xylaria curta]
MRVFPLLIILPHSTSVPINVASTLECVGIMRPVPPMKTGSNGLPPPDEPRPIWSPGSSLVCGGLGLLVDDDSVGGTVVDGIVVVPSVSVGVVLTLVVSVCVGEPRVVVEVSLLSGVDNVIVGELSIAVSVGVKVVRVWLGVKKVRVVVGVTIEVTEVAWKSGHSASSSPPRNASPNSDLSLTSTFLQAATTFHWLVIGDAVTANEVLKGPTLKYNPGLIDPTNAAWNASRKPLVAAWELVDFGGKKWTWKSLFTAEFWKALFNAKKGKGKTLFTVNVHFASKGGSSSLHGDARPPVNGGVDQRIEQAESWAIGDFNEFAFAPPIETFTKVSGLKDLDEVAKIPTAERYSYLFDSNSQELDHTFVSKKLAKGAKFEHPHINTWLAYDDMTSDHDPSVAKFNIC